MADVSRRHALRDEELDGLTDQLVSGVPECGLGARVRVDDPSLDVDPDDGIRCGLEHGQVACCPPVVP